MKLSTRSRYCVRALLDIICKGEDNKPVALRKIAMRQNVSEKYLEQLFIILRKGGIVKASRGVKGGYILNKRPEEIYLGDILRLTELSMETVSCKNCDEVDDCMCRPYWDDFSHVILDYVDSITLKDMYLRSVEAGDKKVEGETTAPVLVDEIMRLKKERNAVLLVHNYQRTEIQEIADYLGDSLDLSKRATQLKEEVIVFCGVRFMAESSKLLSPHKTVLLPRLEAGCPMADMITAEELREMKEEYPKAKVVCYVNTSAAVKAESDICCTSANVAKVIESLKAKQIIFVPDKNLADFAGKQTKSEIIPWYGYCYVHEFIRLDDIKEQERLHPQAIIVVHPEVRPEVADYADYVLSTNGMVKLARKSSVQEFIIGTEEGLVERIRRENPSKKFYLPKRKPLCSNMKRTRLIDVFHSLRDMKYTIELEEEIMNKARESLEKMIKIA